MSSTTGFPPRLRCCAADLVPNRRRHRSSHSPHANRSGAVTTVVIVSWLVIVLAGMLTLWRYERAAGDCYAAPSNWPQASLIPRSSVLPKLLLFAHPKCPCTRATIVELGRLLRYCPGQVECSVIFIKPAVFSSETDWERTVLWHAASDLPDTTVLCDNGSVEGSLFGVTTSGTAVLFDANGQLLFQGGITSFRGHEGDSTGKTSIIDLVNSGESEFSRTEVFGCDLGITPKNHSAYDTRSKELTR